MGSKKEHTSVVSGVLLFDMWEKKQKANKTFLHIKKKESRNPSALYMLYLFMVYPQADIYYYTQLSVMQGDADLSFRTENLWACPLLREDPGVIYPLYKYGSSPGRAVCSRCH